MTKPTVTLEDIIAYHEGKVEFHLNQEAECMKRGWMHPKNYQATLAAAHREAAALLRRMEEQE